MHIDTNHPTVTITFGPSHCVYIKLMIYERQVVEKDVQTK